MKDSEFVFDYVRVSYYKCHKINPNCGGSYIDSPDRIKSKTATINSINKKNKKCYQYTITVELIYEEIKKDQQRITKIKPFINKDNWEGINIPSEKGDWQKIEKNNLKIDLNVLYAKKEKMYPAYGSKHNSNREKQVIFLMILHREKLWHYLAVKKLSALLRAITSRHRGDFYCLNCLHSFAMEKKLESHKKACKNKDFCNVIMPSIDIKI